MTEHDYAVRFVDRAAQISAQLWKKCFPPPLEGLWWYETLEESGLEDQFAFSYAVISERGRDAGIAPVFVMNVPISLVVPPQIRPVFRAAGRLFPRILYQRTLFVGSPCSDEGTVGFSCCDNPASAVRALHTALTTKAKSLNAPMLVWKDFPASSGQLLQSLARENKLFTLVSFPGTIACLEARSKDAYFAALKPSHRQVLRRKLRKSASLADLDIAAVQNPDSEVLDGIFALFQQTYNKASTKFERLNRAFFQTIARQPVSYFIILRERQSGDAVAFMLCFVFEDAMINKFIGIDYTRPKDWMLYFRLWDAAVDFALSRGLGSIQSGQTGYRPKLEIGHRLIPLTNYCRHSNPIVNKVYAAVARKVSWATLDKDLAQAPLPHILCGQDGLLPPVSTPRLKQACQSPNPHRRKPHRMDENRHGTHDAF